MANTEPTMSASPEQWRVEDFAQLGGVSVDTVRYYQKLGLLPSPTRQGRTAVYGADHLQRLQSIRRLSDEGFTLRQIERILDGDDPLFGALQPADQTVSFDELVEQSGFGSEIVELAIDAGLIQSLPTSPDRFDREAQNMLAAGAALLGAGLPLEELLAIALRHAEHVESVVDDAIELFQRHLDPRDRDHRAETVAELVPLVSDLVAGHFRQTLVDRASNRLLRDDGTPPEGGHLPESGGGTVGVHTVVRARRQQLSEVDPLAVFSAAAGQPRAYWSIAETGVTLAAVGAAFVAAAPDPANRFADISAALGGLTIELDGDEGPLESGPLLLGGIGFSDRAIDREPDWHGFGSGALVLPELLVADTPEGAFMTRCGEHSSLDVDALVAATGHPTELGPVAAVEHRDDPAYEELVASALRSISDGTLAKVVTARTLRVEGHIEVAALLARLGRRFPTCAIFAFDTGASIFLGASPEQLVARRSSRVDTMALAGTRPRHDHPGLDAQLRASLLASPKERLEHQMVVDDIRATLRNVGVALDPDQPTGVLQLQRNQHLHTPIGGVLTDAASTLDLVAALHPTPAVAGLPRRAAQDWIDTNETFDRGWYASPVGWTTLDGAGEFRVALRSGLLDPDGLTLFAGGGIVDGSVPSQELAETSVKFEALLGALDL